MTDIVERLREGIDPYNIPEAERVMDGAADEIDRLRSALRTAISLVEGSDCDLTWQALEELSDAKDALEGKTDGRHS